MEEVAVERVRVLLVHGPGVLREIIKEVVGAQADMEVVGELDAHHGVVPEIDRTGAEFVVWCLEPLDDDSLEAIPDACRVVLDACPRVKVLAVEDDGRTGSLYEMRPWRRRLGELGTGRILGVLRGVATPTPVGAT
jgi:DNA-binding NarL/FixJ family response regulator